MGSTPAIDEYLQAIFTLTDGPRGVISARLADYLAVSAAAVSEMAHRMEREGYVTFDERKEIHLSGEGRSVAATIMRRHRLAERMLTDLLGFEWWETHEEAERLEHAMSPALEARLIETLGNPQTCPHGNPMPGAIAVPTRPLEQVAPGSLATIERIPDQFEHEPGFLAYVASQGLRPGLTVKVIAVPPNGPLRLEIDGTIREVRRDCGHKVWVRS